ncbi:MAG: DUF2062 domain-containing protein [Pseudomonadota bacterium]
MRKLIHRYLPAPETIKNHPWAKPFARWLAQPDLWHLHRRSVAGGVAIGLFCGLIPGPVQMLSAVVLAGVFRVNLPVAAATTLYTNPFTIVPLYLLAYQLGIWVSGAGGYAAVTVLPEIHWNDGLDAWWNWLGTLGEPLLIGLPLLALSLAVIGYLAVRLIWRVAVLFKLRAKRGR